MQKFRCKICLNGLVRIFLCRCSGRADHTVKSMCFLGFIYFIYTDSSHLVIRTHSYVVPGIIKIFSENDFRAAGMLRGKVFYAVD